MAAQLPTTSYERFPRERPRAARLLEELVRSLSGRRAVLTVADDLGWLPSDWLPRWGEGLFGNRAMRRRLAARPDHVLSLVRRGQADALAFAGNMAAELMARLNFVLAGREIYHLAPGLVDRLFATTLEVPSEALTPRHGACLLVIGTEDLGARLRVIGGRPDMLAPLVEGPPLEVHATVLPEVKPGVRRIAFDVQQEAGRTQWGWTLDLMPGRTVGDAVDAAFGPERMRGELAYDVTLRLAHLAANALLCLRSEAEAGAIEVRKPAGEAGSPTEDGIFSGMPCHVLGTSQPSLLDLGHAKGRPPAAPGRFHLTEMVGDPGDQTLVRLDPVPATGKAPATECLAD